MSAYPNVSVPRELWDMILDYLDSHSDVDQGNDGLPQANDANRLLAHITHHGLPDVQTPAPLPQHTRIVAPWLRPHLDRGFSLIELMIVVVVIGILAAIAIPNYIALQDRAKEAATKANMHSMQLAAESYMTEHDGIYADNAAALAAGDLDDGDYSAHHDRTTAQELFVNPFSHQGGEGISWENRASVAALPIAVPGIVSYADADRQAYSIKGEGKSAPLHVELTGGDTELLTASHPNHDGGPSPADPNGPPPTLDPSPEN